MMPQIFPLFCVILKHLGQKESCTTYNLALVSHVSYMWNVYRCSEGMLWDIYRCNSGILSRLIFILWSTCFYAVSCLVLSFYLFFCCLIPKKRLLDICTSSYHALTCDYRKFHAYIALCGCGEPWAVLTERFPPFTRVQVRKTVQHLCLCPGEAAVNPAAEPILWDAPGFCGSTASPYRVMRRKMLGLDQNQRGSFSRVTQLCSVPI